MCNIPVTKGDRKYPLTARIYFLLFFRCETEGNELKRSFSARYLPYQIAFYPIHCFSYVVVQVKSTLTRFVGALQIHLRLVRMQWSFAFWTNHPTNFKVVRFFCAITNAIHDPINGGIFVCLF